MHHGIFLGLGSNLGDRQNHLNQAISLLRSPVLLQSSIYETEPLEFQDQPWFLNMVIKIETDLTPMKLLRRCQSVELQLKRKREIPKGPRTIDLDILFYNDLVCSGPELTLPHAAIPQRRFVLEPLNEIATQFVHPVLKKTIGELLQSCGDQSIVRIISRLS